MRKLIAALLGLSLSACSPAPPTPTFVLHAAGASLVVRVTGDYGVQYMRPGAWEVARAVLQGPNGQEATAEGEALRDPATGARRAALTFAGLAPGDGYTLALTLLRREGDALQAVGQATIEAVTLAAGANALAVAPGQIRASLPAPAPQALRGFVSSLPGAGMIARLNAPEGVVAADDGTIYVADSQNGSIRRLATDAQGRLTMTHLAGIGLSGGYADGVGAAAKLNRPNGMAIAPDGALYVADSGNARVRRIVTDAAGQVSVTTLRNATGGNMLFHGMVAVGVEPAGTLVVAMPSQLLRLTPSGQGYETSVLAGDATAGLADGAGTAARFSGITDLAVAPSGTIYVADGANGRVRVVTPEGVVSSLPGSYPGVAALTVTGGQLYMARPTRFSRLDLATGASTDLAGGDWPGSVDGPGSAARFSQIAGIAVAPSGTIFIADAGDHRLRRAEPQPDGGLFVGTVAGDGEAGNTNGPAQSQPLLKRATAVAVDPRGGVLVADAQGHRVMRIAPGAFGDYDVEVLAGTGVSGASDGPGTAARFNGPAGLAVAPDGAIYVTDLGNNRLRKLVRGEDGAVTVSTVTSALEYPTGVAVTEDGRILVTEAGFPSDHPFFQNIGRRRVVEVVLDETGAATVVNLAGAGRGFAEGPGAEARFLRPTAIAPAPDGTLYVADAEDHRIRVLTPLPEGGYTVSTLAGDGVAGWTNGPLSSARFNRPASLALDPVGRLYVADYWNHRLQVIEDGEVRTVTGGPNDAYVDGPVGVARFSKPVAVAIGPDGAIYVADSYPHGVRKVSP